MTAAVLYTLDLEPITVIDVPMWAWERLRSGDRIVMRVPAKFSLTSMSMHESPAASMLKTVTVFGEKLRRNGSESLILFTEQDEFALALKSTFLPGQRFEVQRREREAEVRGLVEGLFLRL